MYNMKPLLIHFTDEERDDLEKIKKRLGLRRLSDTVRTLIRKEKEKNNG